MIPDAIRRGIRTLIQALPASAVVAALVAFGVLDATDAGKIASLTVILTGVFSAVQNALEDGNVIPALLKAPASNGAKPVPNDLQD